MPKISEGAIKRLAAKAAIKGGAISQFNYELDVSGICTEPKVLDFVCDRTPWLVTTQVPCNSCQLCRWSKRKMWEERIVDELHKASRTWFCTLTASPQNHLLWEMLAKGRKYTGGKMWHDLSEKQQGRLVNRVATPDLQKWIKRVRKSHGAPKMLRHIIIPEFHTKKLRGKPHFHVLIHEVSALYPIRKSQLDQTWHLGFTNFKLVDDSGQMGSYISKYVSKDEFHDGVRLKVSLGYGRDIAGSIPNKRLLKE